MDDGQRDEAAQDFRVRVSSKREVSERLDRCKDLLRTAMDGQPEVDEDSKRVVVQELLAVSDGPTTTTTIIGKLRTVFARRKRHFILFLNKSLTFMSIKSASISNFKLKSFFCSSYSLNKIVPR